MLPRKLILPLLFTGLGLAPFTLSAQDAVAKTDVSSAEAPKVEDSPEAKARKAVKEEIEKMKLERDRLEAQMALDATKQASELAALKREKEKIETERSVAAAKLAAQFAAGEDEAKKIRAQLDLESARLAPKMEEMKLKERELAFQKAQMDAETARAQAEITKLNLALAKHKSSDDFEAYALKEPVYTKTPFENGVLTISDRRIAFNGVVTNELADHVTERIAFWNNKSTEFPIFIVIDNSPGGSVQAGYRILKAMEGSQAPVHVVVKSFAASMAATVCTMAKVSYAYPNASILHHQMSSGTRGNMVQMKEQYKSAEEWFDRLATPLAKKMGWSKEEFVKKMYENNSDGDWDVFADQAVKLKWVDHIAQDIRETAILRNPDLKAAPEAPRILPPRGAAGATGTVPTFMQWQQDEQGKLFMELPPLAPFDHYFLYNPRGEYRWR